jgi:hypothetical protein
VRRISRALDTIWRTAQGDDESFTDDQFTRIHKLYHEGHELGTHHREVAEFAGASDPLSGLEQESRQKMESDLNQSIVSAIAHKMTDVPEHVRYAMPSWYTKGYEDGRGGRFSYEGLRPFPGGWRYDPPTREDPMRRNGPW